MEQRKLTDKQYIHAHEEADSNPVEQTDQPADLPTVPESPPSAPPAANPAHEQAAGDETLTSSGTLSAIPENSATTQTDGGHGEAVPATGGHLTTAEPAEGTAAAEENSENGTEEGYGEDLQFENVPIEGLNSVNSPDPQTPVPEAEPNAVDQPSLSLAVDDSEEQSPTSEPQSAFSLSSDEGAEDGGENADGERAVGDDDSTVKGDDDDYDEGQDYTPYPDPPEDGQIIVGTPLVDSSAVPEQQAEARQQRSEAPQNGPQESQGVVQQPTPVTPPRQTLGQILRARAASGEPPSSPRYPGPLESDTEAMIARRNSSTPPSAPREGYQGVLGRRGDDDTIYREVPAGSLHRGTALVNQDTDYTDPWKDRKPANFYKKDYKFRKPLHHEAGPGKPIAHSTLKQVKNLSSPSPPEKTVAKRKPDFSASYGSEDLDDLTDDEEVPDSAPPPPEDPRPQINSAFDDDDEDNLDWLHDFVEGEKTRRSSSASGLEDPFTDPPASQATQQASNAEDLEIEAEDDGAIDDAKDQPSGDATSPTHDDADEQPQYSPSKEESDQQGDGASGAPGDSDSRDGSSSNEGSGNRDDKSNSSSDSDGPQDGEDGAAGNAASNLRDANEDSASAQQMFGENEATSGDAWFTSGGDLFAPLTSGIPVERPSTPEPGSNRPDHDDPMELDEHSPALQDGQRTPPEQSSTLEQPAHEGPVSPTSPDRRGPEPVTGMTSDEGMDYYRNYRANAKDFHAARDPASFLHKQRLILKEKATINNKVESISAIMADGDDAQKDKLIDQMRDTIDYLKARMLKYRHERNVGGLNADALYDRREDAEDRIRGWADAVHQERQAREQERQGRDSDNYTWQQTYREKKQKLESEQAAHEKLKTTHEELKKTHAEAVETLDALAKENEENKAKRKFYMKKTQESVARERKAWEERDKWRAFAEVNDALAEVERTRRRNAGELDDVVPERPSLIERPAAETSAAEPTPSQPAPAEPSATESTPAKPSATETTKAPSDTRTGETRTNSLPGLPTATDFDTSDTRETGQAGTTGGQADDTNASTDPFDADDDLYAQGTTGSRGYFPPPPSQQPVSTGTETTPQPDTQRLPVDERQQTGYRSTQKTSNTVSRDTQTDSNEDIRWRPTDRAEVSSYLARWINRNRQDGSTSVPITSRMIEEILGDGRTTYSSLIEALAQRGYNVDAAGMARSLYGTDQIGGPDLPVPHSEVIFAGEEVEHSHAPLLDMVHRRIRLQRDLAISEREHREADHRLGRAEKEFHEANKEASQLRSALEKCHEHGKELEAQLDKHFQDPEKQAAFDTMQKRCEELIAEIELREGILESLSDVNDDNAELKDEVADLKAQLQQCHKHGEELEQRDGVRQTEFEGIKAFCAELEEKVKQLMAQIDEAEAPVDDRIATLRVQVNALRKELAERALAYAGLMQRHVALSAEITDRALPAEPTQSQGLPPTPTRPFAPPFPPPNPVPAALSPLNPLPSPAQANHGFAPPLPSTAGPRATNPIPVVPTLHMPHHWANRMALLRSRSSHLGEIERVRSARVTAQRAERERVLDLERRVQRLMGREEVGYVAREARWAWLESAERREEDREAKGREEARERERRLRGKK